MKHHSLASAFAAKLGVAALALVAFATNGQSAQADPTHQVTNILPTTSKSPQFATVYKGSVSVGGDGTVTTDGFNYAVRTRYILDKWNAQGQTDAYDQTDWPDVSVSPNSTQPIIRRASMTINDLGKYHGTFVMVPVRLTPGDVYAETPYPDGDFCDFEVIMQQNGDTDPSVWVVAGCNCHSTQFHIAPFPKGTPSNPKAAPNRCGFWVFNVVSSARSSEPVNASLHRVVTASHSVSFKQ